MAGWKNISLDDPQDDFLRLRPIVLRVMKTVYRNFDPAHEPVGIDHWWHSPSLSYQVEPGASEPSIVILNLREGQPDNPVMETHFMINLNTQRIHDKLQDVRFAAPADCLGDLETIRNSVRQEVRSIRAAQDKRARDLHLQEEAKRQALFQVSGF
ncbi:hypothetical protein PILCRDRAFT_322621 [Piloderma croceum F 1598]|uniref:Uncharacterized protein n=1 Tax=Piloderma croceum (strain F 1598) TaxID=765440 RepID=A0A0C3G6N4_PILCF|nr:hypothetical protein PILCRDRAFT_322621 [Piloderma croceum F 1598]